MIERYRNGRESGCGVDKNENEKDRERGVGRREVVVRETTVLSLVTGLCAFSLFDLLFLFFSLSSFLTLNRNCGRSVSLGRKFVYPFSKDRRGLKKCSESK